MLNNIYKSGWCWLWVAVLVIFTDYYSKLWVVTHLSYYEPLTILPIFNLTLAKNTGAAFSFLHSASGWQNRLFITFALMVSVMILGWLFTLPRRNWWMGVALSLVLGGALGNVWDRLTYQYVVDFLDFHIEDWHFAIFNIADSAITIGAFMIILSWWCSSNKSNN